MAPTDSPAPPSMMSPYGMPLTGGGPEGYGPFGPGPGGPGAGPDKRRNTLIMSALAVVAVVGIGAAVAVMNSGSPKHDPTALAGKGATATSSSDPAGDGSGAGGSLGGKPDGDSIAAGPSSNGAQGANLPNSPTNSGNSGTGPTGSANGQNSNPGSGNGGSTTSAGNPVAVTSGGQPATSAPGVPAPSNPAPKPSAPSSTTVKVMTGPPSSDCTYLDLPAAQMPVIREGSSNVNAVKELQCLLKKSELGIKPLAIDGSWGANTQSAMTLFQGCNNAPAEKTPGGTPPYPKLAVDGVASAQTWADLYFWDNQYFNGVSYYCNGTR